MQFEFCTITTTDPLTVTTTEGQTLPAQLKEGRELPADPTAPVVALMLHGELYSIWEYNGPMPLSELIPQ